MQFGNMEVMMAATSAGVCASFLAPHICFPPSSRFPLVLATSAVNVIATCTHMRGRLTHTSPGHLLLAPAPGTRHWCVPIPYFSNSYVMA